LRSYFGLIDQLTLCHLLHHNVVKLSNVYWLFAFKHFDVVEVYQVVGAFAAGLA